MESTETNTTSTPSRTNTTTQEGKTIAIIAYITLIGLVIAFIMNNEKKNSFASYHIKQSLGLALTGIALGIVGMIPFLGWIINFLGVFILLYMWIMGLVNAINEKEKPVPILGEKYKEWLKSIK